jgi:hypothetical protein
VIPSHTPSRLTATHPMKQRNTLLIGLGCKSNIPCQHLDSGESPVPTDFPFDDTDEEEAIFAARIANASTS